MIRYNSVLLIPAILLLFSCENSKVVPVNSCYYSEEIEALYLEDVYQIMASQIYADSTHPDRNTPPLNENRKDLFLQAIQSVYDLDQPERDTVFQVYDIHAFPFTSLRQISLNVDPNAPEIQNLLSGKPSGNMIMDSLLTTYEFNEVTPSMFYPDFAWITITSERSWNLIPIYEKLRKLDFILSAENGGGAVGDGNNLVIGQTDDLLFLNFSIGWGDCPAGCIFHRHWVFKTDIHCNETMLIEKYTN